METLTTVLAVILAPFAFVAFWCTIVFLIGRLGGWSRLAAHYAHEGHFSGERWSLQSARLGWSGYSGVLTMGANGEGIYIAPIFPFRPGHPPLFVPWRDISVSKESFVFTSYVFRFAHVPGLKFKVYAGLGERLKKAAGGLPGLED